jgi:hypothetical protein
MATSAAGPTPPDPSRPLTEREQAALARLEAETRREDPEWCDVLAREVPPPRRTSPRIPDLVIQVVVVVLLALLLVPTAWLGGLLVVMVLVGPAGVAWWAMRRGVL